MPLAMALTIRSRGDSSRRLTVLLLVVLLPPATALVWLGFELLAQERALLRQRQADRREAAAELMARSLTQALVETERSLVGNGVAEGTARVRVSGTSVEVEPRSALLWLPAVPALPEFASEPFAAAEQDEHRNRGDRGRARYLQASYSSDPALRAGALVRLARLSRREGDTDAALGAYRRLSRLTDIAVNGMPADLVARRMICDVLSAGSVPKFADEANALTADFLRNRWLLDRPSWELTARDLTQWTGRAMGSAERMALSVAMDQVLPSIRNAPDGAAGRRVVSAAGRTITLSWRRQGGTLSLLAIPSSRAAAWVDAVAAREDHAGLQFALFTASGELVARSGAADTQSSAAHAVRRSNVDTGLPWVLSVSGNTTGAAAQLATRRRLLGAGLAALVLLLGGGSYLVLRVVRRELAVARLQTEFVAAVSHEFRTPLTSLRHVTELLQESDDLPPQRRQAFYAVLAQNGDRLHRLVESVLDFARMEAGRRPWHMRPLDVGAVVTEVVAEFAGAHGHRDVSVQVPSDGVPPVLADPEALGHALWNLLDNAVKYSPDGGAVTVRVDASPSGVSVGVSDHGLGMAAADRGAIFGRFVRGATAIRLGIKGTGLGLALVAHIVEAHRGRVEVESEEGVGSTFTIHLPAAVLADRNAAPTTMPPAHAENSHR